jgi:phosphinothricin acetyltransferase
MAGRIRRATDDDAGAIADIYVPYVLHTAISFELEPPEVEEIRQRLRTVTRSFLG